MKAKAKKDAKLRLARMSGQVGGIAKMVDEDRYCVDILTQVAALRAALEHFGGIVLAGHIEECVYGGNEGSACSFADASKEERIEEVRLALSRFMK